MCKGSCNTGKPSLSFKTFQMLNRFVHFASAVFLGEWALYGAFRCPFVIPFVSCQNCPVVTCPGRVAQFFWGFWGLWIAAGLFFGRAFCSWFCPGGLVNRILALNPFKVRMHKQADETFPYVKYFLLAACLWIWFMMDQPRVNVPIRTGEFVPAILLTFEHAFPMWIARSAIVLAVFAAAIVIPAAWCRFACPAGALLEFFKRFSFFRIYKTAECNDCGKCRKACYMQTRPDEENCTNCGDCLGSCPKNCIQIGRKPS